MNNDIKQLWTAALRSGDYEQGKGRLRTLSGKYCGIGVLCDLYAKEHNKVWEQDALFEPARHWSGLSDEQLITMINANDDGVTFEELAGMIEEQL